MFIAHRIGFGFTLKRWSISIIEDLGVGPVLGYLMLYCLRNISSINTVLKLQMVTSDDLCSVDSWIKSGYKSLLRLSDTIVVDKVLL